MRFTSQILSFGSKQRTLRRIKRRNKNKKAEYLLCLLVSYYYQIIGLFYFLSILVILQQRLQLYKTSFLSLHYILRIYISLLFFLFPHILKFRPLQYPANHNKICQSLPSSQHFTGFTFYFTFAIYSSNKRETKPLFNIKKLPLLMIKPGAKGPSWTKEQGVSRDECCAWN